MKLFFYQVFLFLLFSSMLIAQDPASVQWTCAQPDSQKVSAIGGSVEGFPASGGRNFGVYSYNSGLIGPLGLAAQRWCPFDGTTRFSWGEQIGPVDSQYVQFAVKVKPGFSMHVDSVSMYLGAGGTTDHIITRVLYDLTAEFSSPIMISDSSTLPPRDAFGKYTYEINSELTDTDTLFIRVYTWYDYTPSTSKYLYIQDVNIYGTTQGIANPVSATWELSDPGTGGTGQTVSLSGPVNATDESFSYMRINQYTGAENSQRTDNRTGGITQWPENQIERIDSVYVQFTVFPKAGTSLNINNISFRIGGNSTNYLTAEVLYSLDSTFTSFNKIPDSLVLEGDDYAYPGNLLRADSLKSVSFNLDTAVDDGEVFYLRFYPWVNNQTTGLTGKYLLLKNLLISGEATGEVVFDLPEIATSEVTYISTTFATSGGNIASDGGSAVTARGVAWNTTGSPTIADSKTTDGTGSGSFTSSVTGLIPGATYHLRAYATNVAGTAYGEEYAFATLDSLNVPSLTTTSVTNILVKTAQSGGTVTNWGGSPVTERGIVWNTTGAPTINDSKSESGSGIGSYASQLFQLQEITSYYVRAYAVNSTGTGYGNEIEFTTQQTQPDVVKVVDQSGNGDYTTVQAAFDAVPDFYTGKYTIIVNSGVYYEKLFLDRNKVNVVLQGVHPDSAVLTFDDYAGKAGGTSNSYSVAIEPDDFTAINITFQNTYPNDQSVGDQQAVAIRVNGDRQSYYNCKFLGYQDTYYAWGGRGTGRTYMKGCYIEGSVDFIFGRNIAVFDSCRINVIRNNCSITAANTDAESKYGLVFKNCIITNDAVGFDGNAITNIWLGRAWQASPRTVFLNTELPAATNAMGWNPTPINSGVIPALYAIYLSEWPGFSSVDYLAGIGSELSEEEALDYTLEKIFSKESNPLYAYDWIPVKPELVSSLDDKNSNFELPVQFDLGQNYPNPFNPKTIINYSVPKKSHVKLAVFNILGEQVLTLVNGNKDAGFYKIELDGQHLASGIYFYTLVAGNYTKTRKMILIK